MTADASACDALFHGPLPEGFTRRVFRVEPGLEVDFGASGVPDAIVRVEEGGLELECRAGTCRSFGRGSMIPIAGLSAACLRSVGPSALVLVAVSRAQPNLTDEFLRVAGSYGDD